MNSVLNSTTVMILFDVLITILGLYIVFNALRMKTKDIIPSILLTPKELKYCRDQYGFIDYMFPFTLVFGFVCIAFGVVNILGDLVFSFSPLVTGISIVVLLVVWFLFSQFLRKAKTRFF